LFLSKISYDAEQAPRLRTIADQLYSAEKSKILFKKKKELINETIDLMRAACEDFSAPEWDIDVIKEELKKASDFSYYDAEEINKKYAPLTAEEAEPMIVDKISIKDLEFDDDTSSGKFDGINPNELLDSEEEWDEEDPLERRGRTCEPIFLNDFPELLMDDTKVVMGADFGTGAGDASCFVIRHGPHVVDVQWHPNRDPMEVVGLMCRAFEEYGVEECVLDRTGGLGVAIASRLEEIEMDREVTLTRVAFNERPRNPSLRCLNQRAEMYFVLQERFREGMISLPSDKRLAKQVAYTKFKPSSDGGLYRIVDKLTIKKELGESPDGADALALAFYDMPELAIL
jgi:hypothetical protein